MKPEDAMKEGFEALAKARECFENGRKLYDQRKDANTADIENRNNVTSAIWFLDRAYDEISSIAENDF